jgi:hypothetical protein
MIQTKCRTRLSLAKELSNMRFIRIRWISLFSDKENEVVDRLNFMVYNPTRKLTVGSWKLKV